MVRYEFTPGFDEPNTLATGGRMHYWFNDPVKIGLTADRDEEADMENNLGGADLTLRKSAAPGSNLKRVIPKARGYPARLRSTAVSIPPARLPSATRKQTPAYRMDASLGLEDLFENGRGRVTFYLQDRKPAIRLRAWLPTGT